MNIDEFRVIDVQAREKKPRLFLRFPCDEPASIVMLKELENIIGSKLCQSYHDFLENFGGGRFGYTVIFSADPKSDWYLPKRLEKARSYLPSDLLPFSDDFAGGVYAFQIVDNICLDKVFYWNTDGGLKETEHSNIFEYTAVEAYGED